MKGILQSLTQGVAFGIGFFCILLFSGTVYAVWNYTTTVNSGDPLTAEMWNSLKDAIVANAVVPAGGVVAFNLSSCPTGWTEVTSARGRTIIGKNPTADAWVSQRNLSQTGGEENHTLTIAEMPSHNHQTKVGGSGNGRVIPN